MPAMNSSRSSRWISEPYMSAFSSFGGCPCTECRHVTGHVWAGHGHLVVATRALNGPGGRHVRHAVWLHADAREDLAVRARNRP